MASPSMSGWVRSSNSLLARDLDRDQQIEDMSGLFGDGARRLSVYSGL